MPFWRSSRLKVLSGRATVTQVGSPSEVSACGERAISSMWMSTRSIRSKGKGASVRNTAVLPSSGRPEGPISAALHPASAPTTAIGASSESFIVASAEVGMMETTPETRR